MNVYLHTITAVSMKIYEGNSLVIEAANGTIAAHFHAIESVNLNTVGITSARLERAAAAFNEAMNDTSICDLCPNSTSEGWKCDFCKKNLCGACASLHDCAEPGGDRDGQHPKEELKQSHAVKTSSNN